MTWIRTHKYQVRAVLVAIVGLAVTVWAAAAGVLLVAWAAPALTLLMLWSLRWDWKNANRGGTRQSVGSTALFTNDARYVQDDGKVIDQTGRVWKMTPDDYRPRT